MNADQSWLALEILDCIIRRGTLSAAAQELGLDQTTVARRLSAIERSLGSSLFARIDGRLVPTRVLQPVVQRLQTLAEEAATTLALLRRNGEDLRGNVRITTVGFLMWSALVPRLDDLVRQDLGIQLDLIDDDNSLSFTRNDIDVALRLGRKAEDSTPLRSLGSFRYVLCRPAGLPGDSPLPIVCFNERLSELPEMLVLKRLRSGRPVVYTANRLDLLMAGALQFGAEIMLPEPILRCDPRFVIVDGDHEYAVRSCFLMLHPERRRLPHVQSVARWMEKSFLRWRDSHDEPLPAV